MSFSEIKRKVRQIMEEEFEVDLSEYMDDRVLFDGQLMMDSVSTITLIVRLEEAFSIEVKDEDLIEDFFESINSISYKMAEYLGVETKD